MLETRGDAPRTERVIDTRKAMRRKRNALPRGYVSVTRAQKAFAAFGFLWMAVGLGCTCACGVLVFFGQRERYKVNESASAVQHSTVWRTLIIPLITGVLPAVVFAILSISTLIKFYKTFTTKGKMVNTPASSMQDRDEERRGDSLEVEVLFDEPTEPEAVMARVSYPVQPDEETVERMLRQLRDMGFKNRHENLAALQASCFDLETASDKLANARS